MLCTCDLDRTGNILSLSSDLQHSISEFNVAFPPCHHIEILTEKGHTFNGEEEEYDEDTLIVLSLSPMIAAIGGHIVKQEITNSLHKKIRKTYQCTCKKSYCSHTQKVKSYVTSENISVDLNESIEEEEEEEENNLPQMPFKLTDDQKLQIQRRKESGILNYFKFDSNGNALLGTTAHCGKENCLQLVDPILVYTAQILIFSP